MKRRKGSFSIRAVWAIPALALISLLLGVWGWLSLHADIDTALYNSVGLFNNGNGAYYDNPSLADWRIRVARWGGVIVLFSAGLVTVGILLHERVSTTVARWGRQRVAVIGDDPLAIAAFEVAKGESRSSLWLGAPSFGAPSLRAIALPWPPQDRAKAVLDHAGGADHILVAHDDDAESLTLTRAGRACSPNATITVLMRDVRLAEDAAATLNEAKTRVLSHAGIAARALHNDHPPFEIAKRLGQVRIHALIVGFGQTGQAIARDLIVNCRTTYLALPRLTVIDPNAKALEAVLRIRAPEIDACAETRFIEGQISGRDVHPEPEAIAEAFSEGGQITAAYVCLATDVEAISAAAMLQSLLRTIDLDAPPIFVRVREINTIAPADRGGRGLDALTPFGDQEAILAASEFLSDEPDALARAFCEAYRATLSPGERDDPTNRSAFPWERLDETYRQANRDAVAHIPAKLASAGIDPCLWRGMRSLPRLVGPRGLFDDAAELEALAELEHERWNAQRRMEGWRWSPEAKKDEIRRTHPSLTPYGKLSERLKEYDRAYVRQTQSACRGQ